MLLAKIMAILSCFVYMSIELVDVDSKRAFFVLFQLMLGISVGAANIYRTHVGMFLKVFNYKNPIQIKSL